MAKTSKTKAETAKAAAKPKAPSAADRIARIEAGLDRLAGDLQQLVAGLKLAGQESVAADALCITCREIRRELAHG